jgi:hypothetical protein
VHHLLAPLIADVIRQISIDVLEPPVCCAVQEETGVPYMDPASIDLVLLLIGAATCILCPKPALTPSA